MLNILATRGAEVLRDIGPERLPELIADPAVHLWVDLSGPMDEVAARVMRDMFQFHPLTIEDCFEPREQPKIEEYDQYLYIVAHGLTATSTAEGTETIELDIFLGKRYLVTHHDHVSRSVAAVTELVRKSGELLRRGPATLLHAIFERQADGIEPVLEAIEDRLVVVEDRVVVKPREADLIALLALRRNILHLRRWMTKQREVMLRLGRGEFDLVQAHDALLFRDVGDQLVRSTDLLENYRELTTSVQEAYLSMVNNRLNEVMKFLTVFTSVMMPMTVITGIYGMNFQYMPELTKRWGYPMALGLMASIGTGMLIFFKKRGWMGKDRNAPPEITPRTTRDTMAHKS